MLYFPRWKRFMIWLVIAVAFIVALPNMLPKVVLDKLPQWYSTLHLPMGVDLQGGSRLVMQLPSDEINMRTDAINVMERRLDIGANDFSDYTVSKQGRDKVRVEVPGLFDVQLLKDIVSVRANFSLYEEDNGVPVNDVIQGKIPVPDGTELTYSMDDPPVGYLIKATPFLTNAQIASAYAEPQKSEQAMLTVALNSDGQAKLADFTKKHLGQRLIIVFDNEVMAALRFPNPIDDGYIHIGPIADDVAQNLQTVLSTGPLPTDVTFVEERTIGGDLGSDYAKAGRNAAFGALIVVALFMVISYGFLGLVADIALAANLFILIAILSIIGIPLTLAGFAGLVLVIGVSVDANILIYERIREARRNNYSVTQSISAGFSGALDTILDANVTTFIAAFVLFLLGVGAIHGFALTVTIGILTSLFTTITFTRMIISWWVKTFRPTEIPQHLLRIIPPNTRIRFMRLGKITLGLSTVLILAIALLYVTAGMNYGIDFKGGSLAVLEAKNGKEADVYNIADRVTNLNIGGVVVSPSKKTSEAFLTIASQDNGEDAEQTVAVKLRAEFDDDYTLQRMDVVGPTVSQELSKASVLAIIVSLLAIFAYVWFRFRWQFAIGAVLTTIHDIVILVGIFLVLQWQFNLWSIAALLAIIGYSLNDTIVIYDRIRWILRKRGSIPIAVMIDLAINRTLSRTILTSVATLVAHIPLYYFGGEDMRDFASVLLLGIIIGTYSSIFIAGPLLVLLGVKSKTSSKQR